MTDDELDSLSANIRWHNEKLTEMFREFEFMERLYPEPRNRRERRMMDRLRDRIEGMVSANRAMAKRETEELLARGVEFPPAMLAWLGVIVPPDVDSPATAGTARA